MAELSMTLIIVIVLALLFDFSNGWHDSANAIATVVSTQVLSPMAAVLLAGVLNVAGAFMSTPVAQMVGGGVVHAAPLTGGTGGAAPGGGGLLDLLTPGLPLPPTSSPAPLRALV